MTTERARPRVVVAAHWLFMLQGGARLMVVVVFLIIQLLGPRVPSSRMMSVSSLLLFVPLAALEILAGALIWRGSRFGGWLALCVAAVYLAGPAVAAFRSGMGVLQPLNVIWVVVVAAISVGAWYRLTR